MLLLFHMARKPLCLELDDIDDEASVSLTWSIDSNGNMRHKPSNTKVSTDQGVTFEGRDYQISPNDIWISGSPVGRGAGGFVQKGVIKEGGSQIAVKTIRMDEKQMRDSLLSEIRALTEAQGCPHLVQWYAAFASKSTNAVHVVLEFMDLGSLRDLVRRAQAGRLEDEIDADADESIVPAEHLCCIASQMTRGLEHLHTRRLMHRDIKPENVLHNCLGEVKLSDFGITKVLEYKMNRAASILGTRTYMSPERCMGVEYTLTADIWSMGMVIYELAVGHYPFDDCNVVVLYESLCQRPEPRLDATRFPDPLCSFVAQCLTRDTAVRPGVTDLMRHDLISQGTETAEEFAMWLATLPGL